jgi:hypothetical protein
MKRKSATVSRKQFDATLRALAEARINAAEAQADFERAEDERLQLLAIVVHLSRCIPGAAP